MHARHSPCALQWEAVQGRGWERARGTGLGADSATAPHTFFEAGTLAFLPSAAARLRCIRPPGNSHYQPGPTHVRVQLLGPIGRGGGGVHVQHPEGMGHEEGFVQGKPHGFEAAAAVGAQPALHAGRGARAAVQVAKAQGVQLEHGVVIQGHPHRGVAQQAVQLSQTLNHLAGCSGVGRGRGGPGGAAGLWEGRGEPALNSQA